MSPEFQIHLNSLKEILVQLPDLEIENAIKRLEKAREEYFLLSLDDISFFDKKEFIQQVIEPLERALQSVKDYKKIVAREIRRFEEQSREVSTAEKSHDVLRKRIFGGIALIVIAGAVAVSRKKTSTPKTS